MNLNKHSMLRNAFQLTVFILAFLLLTACQAEKPKTYTIGVINFSAPVDAVYEGFKDGMAGFGYVEGENVTYFYEGAVGKIDALDAALENILNQKPDLIVSLTTPAAQKAQAATKDSGIPVVFGAVFDPVDSGVVDNLTNPNGNLTGVKNGGSIAKSLDWFFKIVPETQRLYVPHNPNDAGSVQGLVELVAAAEIIGLQLDIVEVRTDETFNSGMAEIPADIDAIYLLPSGFLTSRTEKFVEIGNTNSLPVISVSPQVSKGILLSYGYDYYHIGNQLSRLADQVLKGASPSDLPVETSEFFLSINLSTAQAIGLEIPDDILALADNLVR